MENPTFFFMVVLVNRITEIGKRALANQFPNLKAESVSLIVLVVSFIVGAAGVILVFPSANVFAGQGVSPFSELVATGIVIGGFANGVDFIGGKLGDLIDKASAPRVPSQSASADMDISVDIQKVA